MTKPMTILMAAAAVLALAAGPALATALTDAQAGMEALERGDNATAIQLFTRALDAQPGLKGPDRELAFVKRAEAQLAAGQKQLAAADAAEALKLAPNDAEAQAVSDKAKGVVKGPTLTETLDFMKVTIEQNASISYVITVNDTSKGSSFTNTFVRTFSEVVTHPDTCNLSWHDLEKREGQVTFQSDTVGIPFKDVSEVVLMDVVQDINLANATAGHPEYLAVGSQPPITKVIVRRVTGQNHIVFYDRSLAERFANAARHAAELCGGLKASPF
jgi:tetratricopeptide (TPR) repeat protein